jgi:hypothetical protein
MELITERYLSQVARLPASGKHIVAQYDQNHVVVYQAYRESIARFAVVNGYFGGDEYNLNRMSWIKPNFLWMMHRSGWGRKEGQEVILAIWISRTAFDRILEQAVHSSFVPTIYEDPENWQERVKNSNVRLQWDPDYDPSDKLVKRRAIQLGLRGQVLAQYAQGGWIVDIKDITEFVHTQHRFTMSSDYGQLVTPYEAVYPIADAELIRKLQLSTMTDDSQ